MSSDVIGIVAGAVVLVVFLTAWLAGLVYVALDARRRRLPRWLRTLWLVLAAVPMVGFTFYVLLYARPGAEPARPRARPPRRVTLPRAPAQLRQRVPLHSLSEAEFRPVTVPTTPVSAITGRVSDETGPRAAVRERLVLAVLEGPHAGQAFSVQALPARIGRGPEADVRLDADLGVSRRHAELYRQAGVLRVRDTNSAHGTSVNGFTIDDKGLSPGDRIRVGHSLLQVQGGGRP